MPIQDTAMKEAEILKIEDSVDRLRRRSLFVTFVQWAIRYLLYASIATATVVIIHSALSMAGVEAVKSKPLPYLWLGAGAVVLAAGCAAVTTILHAPGKIAVAKKWDDTTGGKDRLVSALQLKHSREPMVSALIEDARVVAANVDPAKAFPLRVPREAWWIALPLAVAIVISILPSLLQAGPIANPVVTEALHNEAARIRDFVAKEKRKDLTQDRREMLERVERLATDISNDKSRKKDALAELSKLMDDLRKDREDLEKKKLDLEKMLKSMQATDKNRELSKELQNGKFDDAANRIEKMIDELKESARKKREEKASKDEIEKLEDKVRELQDVKAKLLKMLKVNMNIRNNQELSEFLGDIEGELGELPDEEFVDGKP
jgi:hypothetical protein